MKRFVLIALLLVSPACHAPTSIQTQAGKTAYSADQILTRVGEFQQAVIDAQQAGKIPQAQARTLVTWTVDAAKTLKATPSGWQMTVLAGWNAVKPTVAALPAIAPWVSTLDLVMATLGQ